MKAAASCTAIGSGDRRKGKRDATRLRRRSGRRPASRVFSLAIGAVP